MSTHINMGTGSIWVRCHKKLLTTKFFHLILILKTQPFTKSKIEYLSFGCEGHWQYSQISIDRISLQSTKTVPDIHFRHSSSLWLLLGSQVPTSVLCLQKFYCICARVSLKEGKGRVFGICSPTWTKASIIPWWTWTSLLKSWTCLTWPPTRWACCCSGWEGAGTPEVEQL